MLNILFLSYNQSEAISFYRSAGIANNLRKLSGHEITVANWDLVQPINWAFILNYDVIFFSRPHTLEALNLCNYVKLCGKKLWIDHDDNLLDMAPENKYYTIYMKDEKKKCIADIVRLADVVSVTNEYLREVFLPYNSNIVVIPNALNDTLFKRGTLKPRKKTMLWRGSDSHIYNLMLHQEPINRLIDEFPDYDFSFIGYYPWFLSPKKSFIEGTDIILYHQMILNLAPSFVHAPISNDSFNRCRSPIAAIEAAYCGAATVAPTFWTAEGGWKIPGTIPYHDVSSYYEAMKMCLSGEVDSVKQAAITFEFVMDVWSLSRVNKLRVELLKTLE